MFVYKGKLLKKEILIAPTNTLFRWVHGIFTTSKNTSAVFLAIWFSNCEFDKIMTTYCHIHSFIYT